MLLLSLWDFRVTWDKCRTQALLRDSGIVPFSKLIPFNSHYLRVFLKKKDMH